MYKKKMLNVGTSKESTSTQRNKEVGKNLYAKLWSNYDAMNKKVPSTNRLEYHSENLCKSSNTNLEEQILLLSESLKIYEMLFGKLFKFLKDKLDDKLYEELKLMMSDELKAVTNGAEVFKREDSLSQILEIINNIAKNSRNNKYNSDTREDMNVLDNFREKKRNLNTSSDIRVLRDENMKIIDVKNNNNIEKDPNAKNLKLSFDFSNRINNLIANSKNISHGEGIETTDLKQALKDSAISKAKMHATGAVSIKPPVQSTSQGVTKNDIVSKYTQNHKASLYNLIKVDNSLISKMKNSKTQSNSKSKSQSREDSNTRSVGINSLPGSKSKSKQTRNNVVFDAVRRETVNLNKIPLTTTNRAIQNQPLLNGKLFLKLNSGQKKEPSHEMIPLGNQHQALSSALMNNKIATNKKINLSTGIKTEMQPKPSTSKTVKRNINYSEIASKERSLNAISPAKLKRNISEVDKKALDSKDSYAQIDKKRTVKNNFLEMTYASKNHKEKFNPRQGEINNGDHLIEIQGEGQLKNSEVLHEIKQSLDDNLKGMFNFSYENFLNKESESEERYSTKKSNDVSENEIISQVEPNVNMSYDRQV